MVVIGRPLVTVVTVAMQVIVIRVGCSVSMDGVSLVILDAVLFVLHAYSVAGVRSDCPPCVLLTRGSET